MTGHNNRPWHVRPKRVPTEKQISQYDRRRHENFLKYMNYVTPAFIAKVEQMNKHWSWAVVGSKMGVPTNQWPLITDANPELLALKQKYVLKVKMKKRFNQQGE